MHGEKLEELCKIEKNVKKLKQKNSKKNLEEKHHEIWYVFG